MGVGAISDERAFALSFAHSNTPKQTIGEVRADTSLRSAPLQEAQCAQLRQSLLYIDRPLKTIPGVGLTVSQSDSVRVVRSTWRTLAPQQGKVPSLLLFDT